ncbi:FecR domain-containing protein [Haloferula sp. A504]|uniref:FecR domain-containing protein n=1 Tax=Haloferula sp. A504 TaxID=3373601 RepID=UPI0031CB121E|nr:FecR family protein [Verrucomicrobiaceae bacterium E54]
MKTTALLLLLAAPAIAAPLKSAKVTQAVNDVSIYTSSRDPRPANVGETIGGSNSVRTGRDSRAELVFTDETVTRLGQNSVFRFRNGTRDVELERGSVLLQVPKSAGGATIRTATVTAAITGTTSMFEYSPGQWVKLLTLEGTQKLYINGQKDPVLVPAGQMIVMRPNARVVPQPVTIDIAKLVATSILAGNKVFGPLPQNSKSAIARTMNQQRQQKREGGLLPTRQVVTGPGVRGSTSKTDVRQPTIPTEEPFFHEGSFFTEPGIPQGTP